MFQTVPLSIIRSFSQYTQQWYMSYRFADSLRAGSGWNAVRSWSCSQAVSKPVWHIPLLRIQWKTPDDGQRNCPKHVEFHSKNKFEKLVHLVGFIIRKLIFVSLSYVLCLLPFIILAYSGTFAKLRRAAVGSVHLYVLLSTRTEQLGSHWKGFHEIWYLSNFFLNTFW